MIELKIDKATKKKPVEKRSKILMFNIIKFHWNTFMKMPVSEECTV